VFRLLFASPREVAGTAKAPYKCYVARLLVETVRNLGVSVIPDPQPHQLPGHSLIPELNYGDCSQKADRLLQQRLKELQQALARLANSGVCFSPEDG